MTCLAAIAACAAVPIVAVTAVGSSGGNSNPVYSSVVGPYSAQNPPNEWWSLSFGGTNATQLGDKVNLASPGSVSGATVMLDSQAVGTGTFPVPITFTIYKPGTTPGSVGAVLATQTKTFAVPERPAASAACAAGTTSIFPGGPNAGTEWFNPATGSCYYGVVYAANFNNFTFAKGSKNNLPTTVVYGVSYNATGPGPASSLNVLFSTESSSGAVTVGSDTDPGNLFVAAGTGSNALGGTGGQITCSSVTNTALSEYNTAVGASGCGTDTQQAAGAPFEPIGFVPAVEIYGG